LEKIEEIRRGKEMEGRTNGLEGINAFWLD